MGNQEAGGKAYHLGRGFANFGEHPELEPDNILHVS